MKKTLIGIIIAITSAVSVLAVMDNVQNRTKAAAAEAELVKIEEQRLKEERLGQYAVNMMFRTYKGEKLSDGKKQVLARAIVRVATEIFETEEHRRAFVAALAIESQFDKFAQSPTGPKGYAQVAKASFHEGMGLCGLKVFDEDVWETDLNLYAGACYFRMILEMPSVNNDPFIAIVAYNQGPNSIDLKTYSKNGRMEKLEPLQYMAKFAFLKRTTTDGKMSGVPAIGDLPTPSKPLKVVVPGATIGVGK